jgi:glycosyltransferase involved in cell wall biosynthesis
MPADVVHADLPTVLLLTQFFAVGGAERVALDMMRSLKERIRFVVMSLDKHQSALGTTVDAFRQLTPYVYCMPDYLSPQLNASFLRYLIDRFQPQVLYVANGSVWVYQALPEVRRRYPHLRMANQVYDHEAGWINHYNSRIASIFDANIGVNRRIAQAYLDRGVTPDRVFLIENAVDGEDFDPSRYSDSDICQLKASLGLPTDGKVVTFIGRLHPQKRPMDFVELARRFDSDPTLTFLMVGDGPLAETVDAELARLRLPNLVRHAFYKPSRDIFAVSDLVVLPSEYEGMPLAVMEAQAMGKPVVVTDVGNNRELLDLTGGGVVVPQIGDVGSLRQAVSQVLAQPPDPQRMRREMLSHFSPQRIAEKYRRALLGE